MKKQYIVVKETPEIKKGAIMEEKCDGGSQGYHCITKKLMKCEQASTSFYNESTVEKQPEWFERVETIAVPKGLKKKVQAYIKKLQKNN